MVRDADDRGDELGGVNRLRDMCLESCREAARPIVGTRVARQRHRGEAIVAVGFSLTNLADERVPVFIREADIADQDVGPLRSSSI